MDGGETMDVPQAQPGEALAAMAHHSHSQLVGWQWSIKRFSERLKTFIMKCTPTETDVYYAQHLTVKAAVNAKRCRRRRARGGEGGIWRSCLVRSRSV